MQAWFLRPPQPASRVSSIVGLSNVTSTTRLLNCACCMHIASGRTVPHHQHTTKLNTVLAECNLDERVGANLTSRRDVIRQTSHRISSHLVCGCLAITWLRGEEKSKDPD